MEIRQVSRKRKSADSFKEPQISMYNKAPVDEISIGEFENFALDRLQVLKSVETLMAKGQRDALPDAIRKATRSLGLRGRKDQLSHFVLRLAFCHTEESRRWFTEYEKLLFRYRFISATSEAKEQFFRFQKLEYSPISRGQLLEGIGSLGRWYGVDSNAFYKVNFEEALDLIRSRKVLLKDGFAYVEQKDLVTLLEAKFRVNMSKQLAILARIRDTIKKDRRVGPLVAALSEGSTKPSYTSNNYGGRVTIDMIPTLAKRSFPLCMQHMYDKLIENSHLRYDGRQTFGLFLKGIGLTMKESLDFWRKAFSRKISASKFDKSYSYNIRHRYGQEGKRADYTPYSCIKIVRAHAGNGEYHSCPFKSFDEHHLKAILRKKKISSNGVEEIIKLVKGLNFGVACQRFFAETHGLNPHDELVSAVGNHPNEYFDASWKHYKTKAETEAERKEKVNASSVVKEEKKE
ncbi:hypothetical protein AAMO2058_000193500 [Amorphochlora amoebiformis]